MGKNENKANVVKLFKDLGMVLKRMPDSDLKTEYANFLNLFMSGNVGLRRVLVHLQNKIDDAKKVSNQTSTKSTRSVTRFWKKVMDMILDTYKVNKEEDDGKE